MLAVQIAEEFAVWVCYVTLALNCACAHAYTPVPVSTMLQDNVMQLSKLLLTGYQSSSVRDTDGMCGRVTQCSISGL